MRVKLKQDYARLRAGAYPDEREQIGALVKGLKALMAGKPVPPDALSVIEEVDAVKSRIPKPEAKD